MLFDKLWAQVKGAERSGTLTVEEALDCATRLPQALFCSMMECLAENGEDPKALVAQVARLHAHMLARLREVNNPDTFARHTIEGNEDVLLSETDYESLQGYLAPLTH